MIGGYFTVDAFRRYIASSWHIHPVNSSLLDPVSAEAFNNQSCYYSTMLWRIAIIILGKLQHITTTLSVRRKLKSRLPAAYFSYTVIVQEACHVSLVNTQYTSPHIVLLAKVRFINSKDGPSQVHSISVFSLCGVSNSVISGMAPQIYERLASSLGLIHRKYCNFPNFHQTSTIFSTLMGLVTVRKHVFMPLSKTFFLPRQRSISFSDVTTVNVACAVVPGADHVKPLGVTLDSRLSSTSARAETRVSPSTRIATYSTITASDAYMIVCSVVSSQLDYADAVLYGVSSKNITQRIQNALARCVMDSKVQRSLNALLHQLHWLPIHHRVDFKLVKLAFLASSFATSSYLNSSCSHPI